MLCHKDLALHYRQVFIMAQHHKYSIDELENLIPFELEIYFMMLMEHLKEVREAREAANR